MLECFYSRPREFSAGVEAVEYRTPRYEGTCQGSSLGVARTLGPLRFAAAGSWHSSDTYVAAQANYGRAVVTRSGRHHETGVPYPIVSPMNASEIEMSLLARYSFDRVWDLRGGAYGAVPTDSSGVPGGWNTRKKPATQQGITLSGWARSARGTSFPLEGGAWGIARLLNMDQCLCR